MKHKIGILGAGNMGTPIALNIAEDGFEVFVYDVRYEDTVEKFKDTKISVVATPKELTEMSDVVVLVVKDTTITWKNIECENGLLDNINGPKIFVDLTTSDPQESEKLFVFMEEKGAKYIDIPMTGGAIGAKTRKLVMMGSGPKEVFDEVKYIFKPLSKTLFYLGEKVGLGHFMKLIHNQLSGAVFLATCEAVFLGQSFGMDPKVMIDVFNEGNARSCATEMKFPKFVLSGTLNAGCSVGILQKDMNLVLNKAKERSYKLPITQATFDYWNAPVQEGNPDLDYAAMLKYMEKLV